MLRFNDGVTINTAGEIRLHVEHDGWYVVGRGMCIPVRDASHGRAVISTLTNQDKRCRAKS